MSSEGEQVPAPAHEDATSDPEPRPAGTSKGGSGNPLKRGSRRLVSILLTGSLSGTLPPKTGSGARAGTEPDLEAAEGSPASAGELTSQQDPPSMIEGPAPQPEKDEAAHEVAPQAKPGRLVMLVLGAALLVGLGIFLNIRNAEVQREDIQDRLEEAVSDLEAGRTAEANKGFASVLEDDPDNAIAHYNVGVAAHLEERLDVAEREYVKALETQPDFVSAQFNLAKLRTTTGDNEEAEKLYLQILNKYPDYIPARVNLGFLYVEQLNRREEGVAEFRKAIETQPSVISRIPEDLRPGPAPEIP